jgi:hypothetical protein
MTGIQFEEFLMIRYKSMGCLYKFWISRFYSGEAFKNQF